MIFAIVIVCHFLCPLMAFDCREINGLLTLAHKLIRHICSMDSYRLKKLITPVMAEVKRPQADRQEDGQTTSQTEIDADVHYRRLFD